MIRFSISRKPFDKLTKVAIEYRVVSLRKDLWTPTCNKHRFRLFEARVVTYYCGWLYFSICSFSVGCRWFCLSIWLTSIRLTSIWCWWRWHRWRRARCKSSKNPSLVNVFVGFVHERIRHAFGIQRNRQGCVNGRGIREKRIIRALWNRIGKDDNRKRPENSNWKKHDHWVQTIISSVDLTDIMN